MNEAQLKKWASIAERMARAFAVSFIGVYVMGGLSVAAFADASLLQKAADAGLASLGSLVLSLLGGNVGNPATPSLLPKHLDPATKKYTLVGESGPELQRLPEGSTVRYAAANPWQPSQTATGSTFTTSPKPSPWPPGWTVSPAGLPVHPRFKTGLLPHGKNADELLHVGWKNGVVPAYPAAVDRLSTITIGLDGNDKYGDCEPTSCDNHRRVSSLFLTGTEVDATEAEVLDLYSRSTSPPFNPKTGANDNGVDMVTGMKALMSGGLNGEKIVAYAKLKDISDASIYAAIDLFGAVIFAVDLQVAQQKQSDATPPVWEYVKSADWGGHAIVAAKYVASSGLIYVGSWGMQVATTATFRAKQLQEVWVPIWPELLTTSGFDTSVDQDQLAADFTSLTGGTLPISVGPAPAPVTPPVTVEPFLTAVASFPKLAAALAKNAAAKKMTVDQYSAWKLAGDLGVR